jgi:hypothetical protein
MPMSGPEAPKATVAQRETPARAPGATGEHDGCDREQERTADEHHEGRWAAHVPVEVLDAGGMRQLEAPDGRLGERRGAEAGNQAGGTEDGEGEAGGGGTCPVPAGDDEAGE